MNKDKGWIKINRKMLEWEHFKERDTFHVFMTLMLLAYPKAKTVDGKTTEAGQVRTHGGRVLCVTALGETLSSAQRRAYALVRSIQFAGCQYRQDIAHRALARRTAAHS